MPKTLHLIDVSPFIHAGHINKRSHLDKLVQTGATWKTLYTPTGGTSLIFNKLYEIVNKGDIVMCCDRNPTVKKDLLPTYKSNRNHNIEIEVEKAAAEYILEECGFTVVARSGYEADDIIYTYVRKLHDQYDEIFIYTGDSDLHFLVDDKVTVKPSSSKGKEVNMANYKQKALKTGCDYNLAAIFKIIKGDSSDCVPALPKKVQEEVIQMFYKPRIIPTLGNYEYVKYVFDKFFPDYSKQVDLIFPIMLDDLPMEFSKPDRQTICNFGNAIHNSMFTGRQEKSFDINPHIEALHSVGAYLEVKE